MTDFVSKQKLISERAELVDELATIRKELTEMGITGNRMYYARGTISEEVWNRRKALAAEVPRIEKKIQRINNLLKTFADSDQIMRDVLKDSLSADVYASIIQEVKNREEGIPPVKLKILSERDSRIDDKNIQVKRKAKEYFDLLIAARKAINAYIELNEPETNKADYIRSISSINTCLPPLAKLQRDISIYNL